MFYSLTGKLVHMEPGVVAIECGGVAFKCLTSMHTQRSMPRIGETATVYTYLNVREDALDLFGFSSKNELSCYKMLTGISGVGPKVAECALLYGLHRLDAFPLDVWMKRAMALLPGVSPADFGENAGVAQQYIFHYARMHPALFERETAVS